MDFITVPQARQILQKEEIPIRIEHKTLEESLYSYIAENIYAPMNVPSFDNSAMDGYAFSYEDYKKHKKLKVCYTIQAGDIQLPQLKEGEAARIFTGAPIPLGADTVIMQEKVTEVQGELIFQDLTIQQGTNVRKEASQTKKGDLLISKNTLISSGVIGLLAGFGFSKLPIYTVPKVGVIITGNELIEAGKPLQKGQIYESNSFALQAVLKDLHIQAHKIIKVKDNKDDTYKAILNMLTEVDVLLITGGISVGDYDFVKESLEKNEVKKVFYKIQQKPGKPLFFGKKEQQYIFALPGNPASVLSCFYQYVRPFLERIKGNTNFYKEKRTALLSSDFEKKNTLTLFLKGKYENGKVEVLTSQESYKTDTLTEANCWIEISGEPRIIKKSEEVTLWKI